MLLNCLFLFFILLKVNLLTQFSASNDEKYGYWTYCRLHYLMGSAKTKYFVVLEIFYFE